MLFVRKALASFVCIILGWIPWFILGCKKVKIIDNSHFIFNGLLGLNKEDNKSPQKLET